MTDTLYDLLALGLTAFVSSTVAAIIGLGGGMLLLAMLPFFLPASALVPVHGVSQLASNFSRTLFALKYVRWQIFPAFFIGSCIGISLVALLYSYIPTESIPLLIAVYILCNLWWPKFKALLTRYESFYLMGAIQTGLGPLVGATGPLTTTLVMNRFKDKDAIVSTNALLMSFSHTAKITMFVLLGFPFLTYWLEIVVLCVGAIVGSFFGTKVRLKIPGERFGPLLKWALTILAVKMLYGFGVGFVN